MILQNQNKFEVTQNLILKQQTELRELVCAYQKLTIEELKSITQQTKNQEEINFLHVNKFLFLSAKLISY
jgi:hypothetical protein